MSEGRVALLRRKLFWIVIGIPNVLSVIYFGLMASAEYVSHSSMLVVNPSQGSMSLSSLLSGGSSGDSFEGAYVLQKYIASWEEYKRLADHMDLQSLYEQGDVISRYGGPFTLFMRSDVALWHYYQKHVKVEIDDKSNIVSVQVRTYSAESATHIGQQILLDTVNHLDSLNQQIESEYIASAEHSRDALEAALVQDESALAEYRAKSGIFDPDSHYSARLNLLTSLEQNRAALISQIQSLSAATPNSPAVVNARKSQAAIDKEIDSVKASIAALSSDDMHLHQLSMKRDNDAALLKEVTATVQNSQLNSVKSRYYLEIISPTSTPTAPERPQRFEWIIGIFLGSMLLWSLVR